MKRGPIRCLLCNVQGHQMRYCERRKRAILRRCGPVLAHNLAVAGALCAAYEQGGNDHAPEPGCNLESVIAERAARRAEFWPSR